MTKFLICVMSCGEPDLPFCLEAIRNQRGVGDIEIREFRDMIEVDAHNAVYQAFNDAPKDMIRCKCDADVVLYPGALEYVQRTITADGNVWLDATTHDYFTDSALHAGLGFCGSGITFKHQTLTLKCDRDVEINAVHQECACLGQHAHHGNAWTAFRYGFHRGLKSQLHVYDAVVRAYDKYKDPIRLAAIRGFDVAQSDLYIDYHRGAPPPMDHNYNNPRLRELYERFKDPSVSLPPRTWR